MDYMALIKDALFIGAIVFIVILFLRQQRNLLDRLMCKNYAQYEYFQKQFEGEVEELKSQRDDARVENKEDAEIKKEMDVEYGKEKKFLEQTEEDWEDEEVDLEKLRERIKE